MNGEIGYYWPSPGSHCFQVVNRPSKVPPCTEPLNIRDTDDPWRWPTQQPQPTPMTPLEYKLLQAVARFQPEQPAVNVLCFVRGLARESDTVTEAQVLDQVCRQSGEKHTIYNAGRVSAVLWDILKEHQAATKPTPPSVTEAVDKAKMQQAAAATRMMEELARTCAEVNTLDDRTAERWWEKWKSRFYKAQQVANGMIDAPGWAKR